VPRRGTVGGTRQQPEAVLEPGQQLGGGQGAHPARRQLDGERDAVQPPAQLAHVGIGTDVHALLPRPVDEELHGLVLAQRRQREHPLARHRQRPAAHGEHGEPRHPAEQVGHQLGAGLDEMLEPVEDQQELTARLAQTREQRLARQPRGVVRQPQRVHHRVVHELRITHRRQLHAPRPRTERGPRRQP